MRSFFPTVAFLVSVVAFAPSAFPREESSEEREALRRRIMERVDRILASETERIRAEIRDLLNRELGLAAEHASKPEHPERVDHPKADHPKADHPKADHPKADHPKADHPKADHPKADHPKADHPKADHPKADHPKAERESGGKDDDDIDLSPEGVSAAYEELSRIFEQSMEAHTAGRYDESIQGFKQVVDKVPDPRLQATAAYNVACGYSLQGDKGRALRWLRRSIELGFTEADHMLQDSDLEAIRGMKEFEQLVDEARAKHSAEPGEGDEDDEGGEDEESGEGDE